MRLALLLSIVASGACSRDTHQRTPCERGARVSLQFVDEDSPVMKRIFTHVGYERDGSPTAPDAIAAGVRMEIDYWREDDPTTESGVPRGEGKRHTDYFLLGASKEALEGYAKQFADIIPGDRELRFEYNGKDWRSYYVAKQPVIDNGSIGFVEIAANPVTNAPSLSFTLSADGKAAFAAATKANRGKKLATIVDGVVMSAPIINGEIAGGKLMVNMISAPAADALLAKLQCIKK